MTQKAEVGDQTFFARLAGEAWAGMVSTFGDTDSNRQLFLFGRLQNAWLPEIWPALEEKIEQAGPPSPPQLALYLALGWTQATTTYRFPGTERWKALLGGPPPEHWLPRTQWHLCWLLHQPESAEHRAAYHAAIEVGRRDPELPGVAEALAEDVGLGDGEPA